MRTLQIFHWWHSLVGNSNKLSGTWRTQQTTARDFRHLQHLLLRERCFHSVEILGIRVTNQHFVWWGSNKIFGTICLVALKVAGSMEQPLYALSLSCIRFVSKEFLSLKTGPSTNTNYISLIFTISFEGHNQNLKKNMQIYNSMEFVRQILMKC